MHAEVFSWDIVSDANERLYLNTTALDSSSGFNQNFIFHSWTISCKHPIFDIFLLAHSQNAAHDVIMSESLFVTQQQASNL